MDHGSEIPPRPPRALPLSSFRPDPGKGERPDATRPGDARRTRRRLDLRVRHLAVDLQIAVLLVVVVTGYDMPVIMAVAAMVLAAALLSVAAAIVDGARIVAAAVALINAEHAVSDEFREPAIREHWPAPRRVKGGNIPTGHLPDDPRPPAGGGQGERR